VRKIRESYKNKIKGNECLFAEQALWRTLMTEFTPKRLFLSLALLLALPVMGKPTPKTPTPQQELQGLYNKINAAAATKDVDGVYAYNDDNYMLIDKKGHVHEGSEGRQELEKALEIIDSIKGITKIQSFSGTDTEATVTVKDHDVAVVANGVTGRAIKVTADVVSRDYWVYGADGWRRLRSRTLSEIGSYHKNF
jgi:hypothetical protein